MVALRPRISWEEGYRAGERLHDEQAGAKHDFSRRKGVVHTEIMLPEGPRPGSPIGRGSGTTCTRLRRGGKRSSPARLTWPCRTSSRATSGWPADDFFDGPLGVHNVFDAIQVSVTVFEPNDMQARIPEVDELIHDVEGRNP